MRINEKMSAQAKEEILDLLQIPSLRPERARLLFDAGYDTVEQVSKIENDQTLVKLFMRAEGFKSHKKTNSEDLTLRYAHLYSFSHRIISEAKTVYIKQKFSEQGN